MKLKTFVVLAAVSVSLTESALATAAGLAWQEPGFVMEEVVATLPTTPDTPDTPKTLQWQESGYVMEEIVVTAPATVRAVDRSGRHATPLHLRVAMQLHALMEYRRLLGSRAGQFGAHIDSIAVSP